MNRRLILTAGGTCNVIRGTPASNNTPRYLMWIPSHVASTLCLTPKTTINFSMSVVKRPDEHILESIKQGNLRKNDYVKLVKYDLTDKEIPFFDAYMRYLASNDETMLSYLQENMTNEFGLKRCISIIKLCTEEQQRINTPSSTDTVIIEPASSGVVGEATSSTQEKQVNPSKEAQQ